MLRDRVRINLATPGFVHRPSPPPRKYGARVPDHVMPGFDALEDSLNPHLEFHFQTSLRNELRLRDPKQPFPGDPLPEEPPDVPVPTPTAPFIPTRGGICAKKALIDLTTRLKRRDMVKRAAKREERFRQIQKKFQQQRAAAPPLPRRKNISVAEGGAIDLALVDDRDYELNEVTGPGSRFRFRLIPWGADVSRAVYAHDNSMVLLLGGRPRNPNWCKEIVNPATQECEIAILSIQQSAADKAAQVAPVLSGGIGANFNEPRSGTKQSYGSLLNSLVFFQLLSTLAMKRLVCYGNRLLEMYCSVAFLALQAQKNEFLQYNPNAMYPSDSSVFSAATFEFGGPHRRTTSTGAPDRYHAGTWSVLTSLGNYAPMHGGHVIFWELGLVVAFPAGASILIPTGIIRYSFVKVRPGEQRYSLLQWAGSGISRWFQNGRRMDIDFAMHATRDEHEAREALHCKTHAAALHLFPVEGELPEGGKFWPFVGTNPEDSVSEEADGP